MTKAMTKIQTMELIEKDLKTIDIIDSALGELELVVSDTTYTNLIADIEKTSEHLIKTLVKLNSTELNDKGERYAEDTQNEYTILGYNTNNTYNTCILAMSLVRELEEHSVLTEDNGDIYAY
jgi:spore coat protein CotH